VTQAFNSAGNSSPCFSVFCCDMGICDQQNRSQQSIPVNDGQWESQNPRSYLRHI